MTIPARNVHRELAIKEKFADRVKAQVICAWLTENVDYVKLPLKGELSTTAQTSHECHLTVEASKQIAMQPNTAKGKEVRSC